MHDSIKLARLGVRSAAVITNVFEVLARSFAVTFGVPDYPFTVVPHPVASRDEAGLRLIASRALDSVARQLAR